MVIRFAVLVALSIACSGPGKSGAPAVDPTPPTQLDGGAVENDASVGKPLTEKQCQQFIRKMLVLGLDELRASQPPEKVPTDEQIEAIFQQLTTDPETMTRCKSQPQWAFECAMAASTVAVAEACEANQGSPSR